MAHETDCTGVFDLSDGVLGKLGALTVRLVRSDLELDAALALRFSIFHDEFGACRDPISLATQRDRDAYDAHCDHLIVIDDGLDGPVTNQIVGTYRLLPHDKAQALGFYSAQEFSIDALLARHKDRRFLELGRSCVLPPYRGRRTIELLWQGIWAYCRLHKIDTMVGCASFPGMNPYAFPQGLAFLHHFAANSASWTIEAIGDTAFSTDLVPREAIDKRQALAELPPLVKGYLRLGATYGQSALIDPMFRSIDVFVTLPVEQIDQRYIKHYGENAQRFAA